jgi:predicted nucleic acid-binding protein
LPIEVVELNATIATVAARLRAGYGILRLPDALVIATASAARADQLVTTDRRWPTAETLEVAMRIQTL